MLFLTLETHLRALTTGANLMQFVPSLLVYHHDTHRFALLNLDSDFDKLHFFDDPRHAIVCTITPDDAKRLPSDLNCEALALFIQHHLRDSQVPPHTLSLSYYLSAQNRNNSPHEQPPE